MLPNDLGLCGEHDAAAEKPSPRACSCCTKAVYKKLCWNLQVARRTGEQCMNFVQHPEQLRETVQHRVDSVVHQADGILHSPRRSSQTRLADACAYPAQSHSMRAQQAIISRIRLMLHVV